VAPGRRDLFVAVAGALAGAGLTVVFDGGASGADALDFASAALLGATLGAARRYPRATWAIASAVFLATAMQSAFPGGDSFVAMPLLAAHAFSAGRWDRQWAGVGGLIALIASSEASAVAAHDSLLPLIFVPLTGWGAGRALREREQVARQLAERARELEEEREAYAALSVRYERAQVASELHDIVAHAISVMVVQAAAGQRLAARDPEAAAETFHTIAGAARQAEQDMGRLVALLGDEGAIGPAPDLGLVEELVARAAGSGLDVALRLEGKREGLPAPVVQACYRVVQEGLTNALRYAAGAAISVLVRGDPDGLLIEVRNAPATGEVTLAGVGTGHGLLGLRERVGACGGTLDAGPTPDGGWLLSARLPRRVIARTS
jgi:signal transduction histidine kinase